MQSQGEFDLEAINQKIDSLSSSRFAQINEYKRLDLRRREIRNQIRELTTKIRADRTSIDDYWTKLEEFRRQRRELLAKIRELKSKSEEVERVLKQFEKIAPREGEELSEKRNKIEWKLQTERLTRDEEKQLVASVKELEIKLKDWNKADSRRKELSEVFSQIRELKKQLDVMNQFRTTNDPEVKARHEQVAAMQNARHELFQEIESINEKMASLDSEIAKSTQEISSLIAQRRASLEGRRVREHETSRAKTRELVEKAKDEARKKLDQNGKLSLDELKLLYSDDREVMK
jgi:uncharacterized coiled-coil DUF342 family protein